jgi:hypothetical protein
MPESGPEAPRGRPPEGRDSHGERHPNGWRVRPGPDGRGTPPQSQPRRPRVFGSGYLIFFLLLLLLNIVLASTLKRRRRAWRVRLRPRSRPRPQTGC